jgi:hypothetical protein
MSAPTKTPNNIKLIAETDPIKMSNSLPRTLDSLRSNKDRQTMKANVHIHKSFVRFMMFAKNHSFCGIFKTMGVQRPSSFTEQSFHFFSVQP